MTLQGLCGTTTRGATSPSSRSGLPLLSQRGDLPANDGRRGIPRLLAAGWRGVRRVRHGEDVRQGELWSVSGGGAEWRVVHRAQSDSAPVDDDDEGVDRREPQLRGRLQPAEPGRAGPARHRRRSLRRECGRKLRYGGPRVHTRSGVALGLGRPLRRLAVGRIGAAGSASSRGGRGGIPTSVAGQQPGDRQPHAWRPRITRSSASTFLSIHGCPAEAAECFPACTTSRRQRRRG